MGISLSFSCSFKPKRKPTERALAKLADAIGCYGEAGIAANGDVYVDCGDASGHGQDVLYEFIDKHAKDYVVIEGVCEYEPYKELHCPPHVDRIDADIRWRRKCIAKLEGEIQQLQRLQAEGAK